MSWFKSIQKGFKDAVDKTKEAGDRMEKIAKQALAKTKVRQQPPKRLLLVSGVVAVAAVVAAANCCRI